MIARRLTSDKGNLSIGNAKDGNRAQFFAEWREFFEIVGEARDMSQVNIVSAAVDAYPKLGKAEASKLWLCRELIDIARNEGEERVKTHVITKARKMIEESLGDG
jgi:hypothetical protein